MMYVAAAMLLWNWSHMLFFEVLAIGVSTFRYEDVLQECCQGLHRGQSSDH